MAKGILRRLGKASKRVQDGINLRVRGRGLYAGGLSSEGYEGGYRDALYDVELLLRTGIVPRRRNWWDEDEPQQKPQDICVYCGNPAEGKHTIHRDGMGLGPDVPLCNRCGSGTTPTLQEIWDKISQTETP